MRKAWSRLKHNSRGAVAPMVALSMVALIASGGIAFDYAHLAALDTELQQAADQAALAAASQLDGQTGACARAVAAASDLLKNYALFADNGQARLVGVTSGTSCSGGAGIKFYQSYDQSTDVAGGVSTADANATYVMVTVDTKVANYAMTPIVGRLSGNATGVAVATLGAGAICKVAPLMICNPNEGSGGSFPLSSDTGKGLKLEAGGGATWAPGNYGYLDFGAGAPSVEQALGSNVNVTPCTSTATVSTKPGNVASVPTGMNTRFDLFDNGLIAYCAAGTGNCSPALNVIKDVIHPQFSAGTAPNDFANNSDNCKVMNASKPWDLPTKSYQPDATTRLQSTTVGTPTSMGLPRDICHAVSAAGDCSPSSSRFGDKNWDRNLYFQVNYGTSGTGWQSLSWLSSWATTNGVTLTGVSRYNIYRAEAAAIAAGTLRNQSSTDARRRFAETLGNGGNATSYYAYATPRCAAGQGATPTIKDRRVVTAAVVNCTAGGVKGSTHITPIGWVDLFVTEPSLDRAAGLTGKDQIYVEIIGGATRPDNSNAFQYYQRQRPRLVK